MKKAVVTGGAGFVGFSLASQLASSGAWGEVLLLDLAPPRAPAPLPSCMAVQIGDVGCAEDVMQACRGADLVVHVAAYGMSGAECRDAERIRHVNVTGTKLLLAACLAQGVGRLLFLSSYNAVFDGRRPQPGMTEESAAHVSPASCRDTYSLSKAEAEQLVLAANGAPHCPPPAPAPSPPGPTLEGQQQRVGGREASLCTSGGGREGEGERQQQQQQELHPASQQGGGGGHSGGRLLTCVVRPPGIWGPGELRHVPRICRMAREGLLVAVFGSPSSQVDWVHITNLVSALQAAAQALEGDAVAAGQVYFVSDGQPINNFDFMKPLITGLGYSWPRLRLPYTLMLAVAAAQEMAASLCTALGTEFTPLLNCMEVQKCAVTHWAQIDKARKELGYQPWQGSVKEAVDWYRAHGYGALWGRQAEVAAARQMVRLVKMLFALGVVVVLLAAWALQSRRGALAASNQAEL